MILIMDGLPNPTFKLDDHFHTVIKFLPYILLINIKWTCVHWQKVEHNIIDRL